MTAETHRAAETDGDTAAGATDTGRTEAGVSSGQPQSDELTYAFLVGCSRSGTSALVRLINQSSQAAIGLERYKYRRLDITPDDFSRSRFFEFRAGETNVTPAHKRNWAEFYRTLQRRWDAGDVTLTGDKIGPSPLVASHLEESFTRPRFVFIYRDLERVASSFTARALNPDDDRWPSHRRHKHALRDWHAGFEAAALLLAIAGSRIFVVRYETLFSGDLGCARALFHFLGIRWTGELERSFVKQTARWEELRSKPLQLTERARRYLASNARRELAEHFDGLAALAIQRWLPGPPDRDSAAG